MYHQTIESQGSVGGRARAHGGKPGGGAAGRDLGGDGPGQETPLPAAAVGPEGRGSSREWGLLERVCNSRLLYFISHSIILIGEPETDETTSHTTCVTFTGW